LLLALIEGSLRGEDKGLYKNWETRDCKLENVVCNVSISRSRLMFISLCTSATLIAPGCVFPKYHLALPNML